MNVILAFYPYTRGLGYACVHMPKKFLDGGSIRVRPASNERMLHWIRRYLAYYKPKVVLLRDGKTWHRHSRRLEELFAAITEIAKENNLPTFSYSRRQVRDVFEQFQATSKYQINQRLIEWFPELSNRVPKMRRMWQEESHQMALFDALALAVTHEYLTE